MPPSTGADARTPLAIAAATGSAYELVAVVDHPAADTVAYRVESIVGVGPLLTELAQRLAVPLLESVDDVPEGTHVAITGGVSGSTRDQIERAVARGLVAAALIHADTTIGPWVTIGAGSHLSPGVRVTGNVTIGRHCRLHTSAVVSHDDVLGEHVTLSPSATLCGGVTIGDGAVVFAGATVMPGVTIGDDAVVGAGAVVTADVAAGTTVVGVPARPLRASTS
ncbi:MAG: acetyltransferase [Actinomycetota bacterium]